jgi:hypothetical protein
MAPANTNSDPDNTIDDNEDDTPSPSVYTISQTEQHDLVETTLSHIDAMMQRVTTHSTQPIEPPQEWPASSLFGRLRIGSRNSKLALIQASSVAAALFKVTIITLSPSLLTRSKEM